MSVARPGDPLPVVLVDKLEKDPWRLPFEVKSVRLETADYTIEGLEEHVMIERKSLADFVGTVCGGERRERFKDELRRMVNASFKAVIVEASRLDVAPWIGLNMNLWKRVGARMPSHVAVLASADSFHCDLGVPVLWMGSREEAERSVTWMLRRLWALHLRNRTSL